MAPSNLADQVVLAVKDEMRGVRYRLGEASAAAASWPPKAGR